MAQNTLGQLNIIFNCFYCIPPVVNLGRYMHICPCRKVMREALLECFELGICCFTGRTYSECAAMCENLDTYVRSLQYASST